MVPSRRMAEMLIQHGRCGSRMFLCNNLINNAIRPSCSAGRPCPANMRPYRRVPYAPHPCTGHGACASPAEPETHCAGQPHTATRISAPASLSVSTMLPSRARMADSTPLNHATRSYPERHPPQYFTWREGMVSPFPPAWRSPARRRCTALPIPCSAPSASAYAKA